MPYTQQVDGMEAMRTAYRKARYGRYDWLLWTDTDGEHAIIWTLENLKRVVAAVAQFDRTAYWYLVEGGSGMRAGYSVESGERMLAERDYGRYGAETFTTNGRPWAHQMKKAAL